MILPAAAIALASIANVSAVTGAESDVPVETYQLNDGTNCFLVPLQADAVESTSEYVDVAALVDFSAAQLSSDVRKATLETVEALVANLPKNARVQLFAVSMLLLLSFFVLDFLGVYLYAFLFLLVFLFGLFPLWI